MKLTTDQKRREKAIKKAILANNSQKDEAVTMLIKDLENIYQPPKKSN